MMVAIIIILIIAVLSLLLLPKKIHVRMKLLSGVGTLTANLMGIKINLIARYALGNEFYIAILRHNGTEKKIFTSRDIISKEEQPRPKKKLPQPFNAIRKVENVDAYINIGVESNAFLCVMLTGALKIVIENIIRAYLDTSPNIVALPTFTKNCFILKLEGIISVRTTQIILGIIKASKGEK